ncbi:MAG: translation initiation factor IF-2 [Maricaulaceae bacterium]
MTENNNNSNPPRRPLKLKTGGGATRSSGNRMKSVVVEKKKRRIIGGPGKTADSARPKAPIDEIAEAAKKLGLSKAEFVKRQEAVNSAAVEQARRDEIRQAEEAERQRRMKEEQAALDAKRKAEEDEQMRRLQAEEEERKRQEIEEARRAPSVAAKALADDKNKEDDRTILERAGGRIKKKRVAPPTARTKSNEPRRRKGKLTIVSALSGDNERQRSLASMRRARQKEKQRQQDGGRMKVAREVTIPEAISVADLANRMAERAADVVKYLMRQGDMVKMNDMLDADTAQLVAEDFGHIVKRVSEADVEDDFIQADDADDSADLVSRPPVIAVMGHVDHGKTSIIDALRSADIAAGEAGGITQHIGAYQIKTKGGQEITVLDTPGHAAFSAMRTRGAKAVDIVILVVAADDGIMPQTIESIKHAQAAGTPIIVAVNKIDTYEANPLKVETDLLQHSVITESMSGETQSIHVSAKEKTGLDELVEAINLQAELMDLKANPKRVSDGLVIESKIEKGRGPVATLLIQRGTLKRGDIVVAGEHWGKVKAMLDERGKQCKQSIPSSPVAVMGFNGAPAPGEPFAVVETEARAREITEYRLNESKKVANAAPTAVSIMEQMMRGADAAEVSNLPLLVKADVKGSAEAIKSSLEGAGNEEVKAQIISSSVGAISESDVLLAKSSNASILAFNVRPNRQAKDLAEREGVEIRYYSIIYALIDDVKAALSGLLKPERRETFIGYAEILEVFNISKTGKVAGCKITEGKVERACGVRLLRENVVIHEGMLKTLKRFKDEVDRVQAGMECGMAFENYEDIRKSDQIECFTVEMIDRTLD